MGLKVHLGALTSVICTSLALEACTLSIPSYVVASPVVIEVVDRWHPVSHLPVEITQFDSDSKEIQVSQSTTDEKGRATFQIAEGRYYVNVGNKEIYGSSVQIRVVTPSKLKRLDDVIHTNWPAGPVIESRFPRGTIKPSPSNNINLRDAITQRIFATTTPKTDGTFDFGTVPDGLYSINFSVQAPTADRIENVPVEIAAQASHGSLSVELLKESSCGGVGYRDLSAATKQPKPNVESKCGVTLHGADQYEFKRSNGHTKWVPAEKFNSDDFDLERALVSISKEGLVIWIDRQDGSPIELWSDWTNYCVTNSGEMRVHSELTLVRNSRDYKNVIRDYEVNSSGVRTVIQESAYDEETRMPVTLGEKDLKVVSAVPVPLGPGAYPSPESILEQAKAHAQTH